MAACTNTGYATSIIIDLQQPLQQQGAFQLVLKKGSDGNTLVDENDQQTQAGSTLAFQVSDTVSAAFTYAIHYGCDADTVLFQHAGANGVTRWLWQLDDGGTASTQNTQALYTAFTKKNIRLAVSNGVCADTATATLVLDNTLTVDFTMQATPCSTEPVAFTSAAKGQVVAHQWLFGDGAVSSEASPAHRYALQSAAVYQVQYTVTDAFGCTRAVTKPLELNSQCSVFVPNAFTPDGDGRNDVFVPLNVSQSDEFEFRILNRWGQVLFYTKKSGEGWDGRYHGSNQTAGTYIWMVRYADNYSKKIIDLKGTLVLIR